MYRVAITSQDKLTDSQLQSFLEILTIKRPGKERSKINENCVKVFSTLLINNNTNTNISFYNSEIKQHLNQLLKTALNIIEQKRRKQRKTIGEWKRKRQKAKLQKNMTFSSLDVLLLLLLLLLMLLLSCQDNLFFIITGQRKETLEQSYLEQDKKQKYILISKEFKRKKGERDRQRNHLRF